MKCARICVWDCDCNRYFLHHEKPSGFNKLLSALCSVHSHVGSASSQVEVTLLHPIRFSTHPAAWPFLLWPGNNLMIHLCFLLGLTWMKARFSFLLISSLLKANSYPGISFMNNSDLYLPDCHLKQAFL